MESINDSNQSAVIFSGDLIRQLDGSKLRLPSTYIGVRQVRPAGGRPVKDAGKKRKRDAVESTEQLAGDIDDDWLPNVIGGNSKNDIHVKAAKDTKEADTGKYEASVVYKVTNPDGTERRMTSKEKRQMKYEMKRSKHLERKEQKKIEVEERVRIEKEKKKERKRLKWLAKQKKMQEANNQEGSIQETKDSNETKPEVQNQPEDMKSNDTDPEKPQSNSSSIQNPEDQDEETERKYRGNPPVMLTPAATRVALDLGVINSNKIHNHNITTVLDDDLAKQWATQLLESMVPIEKEREKESIRPMPYKLMPEAWMRLRPVEMNESELNLNAANDNQEKSVMRNEHASSSADEPQSTNEQDCLMTSLRNPSLSFDESTYFIFRHLRHHFNLHLACGARFGCDYLVYDGRREDKHSFAGLRIYHVTDNSNGKLPIPSAYDMHGFVRMMNTARKLALVATVVRNEDDSNAVRVAIVDLALEAILTAPTHIRKGNTEKRRFVENTDQLSKKLL